MLEVGKERVSSVVLLGKRLKMRSHEVMVGIIRRMREV